MIVTIESEEKAWDIAADENSSIENTLRILMEKGMVAGVTGEVYSMRKKRNVDTEKSYRENGIYHGDILKIG